MSWFKSLQKGFKDAVDKTKEAGTRMEKLAKEALEKTKSAMLASLPQSMAAAVTDSPSSLAKLKQEVQTYQAKNAAVGAQHPVQLTDKDGCTLLHLATKSGTVEVVTYLLDSHVRGTLSSMLFSVVVDVGCIPNKTMSIV